MQKITEEQAYCLATIEWGYYCLDQLEGFKPTKSEAKALVMALTTCSYFNESVYDDRVHLSKLGFIDQLSESQIDILLLGSFDVIRCLLDYLARLEQYSERTISSLYGIQRGYLFEQGLLDTRSN